VKKPRKRSEKSINAQLAKQQAAAALANGSSIKVVAGQNQSAPAVTVTG